MAEKRKLSSYSLDKKYEIIKAIESGTSRSNIEAEYGVKHGTLCGWIKNSKQIKEQYESSCLKSDAKKIKNSKNPELEKALYMWYCDLRKKDSTLPIGRDLLCEKAEHFAKELGVTNFVPSNGWFSRFKQRYGLTFKRVCGEAKDADLSQISDWQERLQNILAEYKPKDIYNADETALYYKCTPDYTYTPKGEAAVGGKQPKDRVTLLVAANMDGTDKLPLLLIGKYKKPRAFKHVSHLPLKYENNQKAWMTSSIFTAWLQQLDRQILAEKRKIVMIVDNCSAHPHVEGLKAIRLVFLPPNSTSITQPMDQGIIRNLKVLYRKSLTKKKLTYIEMDKQYTEDLLGAMHALKKAWEDVKEDTIKNCFFRAFVADGGDFEKFDGFDPKEVEDESGDPFYDLIGIDKAEFEKRSNPDDEEIECSATSTDEDILMIVKSNEMSHDDEDPADEENFEETPEPPTVKDAIMAM
jgi:hypothetical protein